MSNIKNPQRFAELEYTLQEYFDGKVASVMTAVKNDLQSKQTAELRAYQKSAAGILSSVDSNGISMNNGYDRLKLTGKWNSKTVEDYVQMVNIKLVKDGKVQKDIATIASEWRSAVIKEIGRVRYDELSKELGTDLAYAYVGTRFDDLMMNKLVKDNMPKSTADYIIRKTAQGSIWGIDKELMKSPLAREIEERGEKAFKPSKGAKVAGKLGSSVIDAVTLGGASWKSFATYVGGDVALNAILGGKEPGQNKELTMEAAISKGVFGSNSNVFTGFRQESNKLQGKENSYLNSLNSKLNNKIATPFKPIMEFNIFNTSNSVYMPAEIPGLQKKVDRSQGKYKDVPLMVAPGKEDEYLAFKAKMEAEEKAAKEKNTETMNTSTKPSKSEQVTEDKPKDEVQTADAQTEEKTTTQQVQQTATTDASQASPSNTAASGWDSLLNATGLSGLGDIGNNLGYVISMLPDVLLGMFTGKSQTLMQKNSLMPLAAILGGLFVKNPLLKMVLIGMGGANLVNRAGHDAINLQKQEDRLMTGQAVPSQAVQYKQYADQPLNPRIASPVLQGNTLIATIDRVPCNILLTSNVVAAYQAGALPLNTLANAVLAKHDAMQGMVAQQTIEQPMQQQEAIHRTR